MNVMLREREEDPYHGDSSDTIVKSKTAVGDYTDGLDVIFDWQLATSHVDRVDVRNQE
jgi:hypothetical protein